MNKHTPSPWYLSYYNENQTQIHGNDGTICICNTSTEEEDANGFLIASAPAMFDYIEYVENKISIEEIPMTFNQWVQAEIDLKE